MKITVQSATTVGIYSAVTGVPKCSIYSVIYRRYRPVLPQGKACDVDDNDNNNNEYIKWKLSWCDDIFNEVHKVFSYCEDFTITKQLVDLIDSEVNQSLNSRPNNKV